MKKLIVAGIVLVVVLVGAITCTKKTDVADHRIGSVLVAFNPLAKHLDLRGG